MNFISFQGAEESIRRLEAQIEVEKQTQMFLKQENERLAAGGSGPASVSKYRNRF